MVQVDFENGRFMASFVKIALTSRVYVQVDFENGRFMAWRKLMRANKIGHGASGF